MNDGRKDHVIEVSRSAYIEGSGSLWHLKGPMEKEIAGKFGDQGNDCFCSAKNL